MESLPTSTRPILALLVLLTAATRPADAASLTAADRSFAAHDLRKAATLYREVMESSDQPSERTDAAIRLAMLEWRYFENDEAARSILRSAVARESNVADILNQLADLETARGRYSEAREAALRALLHATSESQRRDARLRWAGAVVEELHHSREPRGPETESKSSTLQDGLRILRDLVRPEPGQLDPSRLLLRAALIAGDGPLALEGWESYYRVPRGGEPYHLLREAYSELTEILPSWNGSNTESNPRVVRALAASRFFEDAAAVVHLHGVPPAERGEIEHLLAYADLIGEIQQSTDEYYRLLSIGEAQPELWTRSLITAIASRWERLELPGEAPVIPPDADSARIQESMSSVGPAIEEAFDHRYGAYINLGTTAGYLDLHMGHVVENVDRRVGQYGQTAEVRFVLLDRMVSNGFQSWAWAYRSQHGGWAKPEAIYQVRPASADRPIRLWRMLTDPDRRREWEEEIRRDSARDEQLAAGDPYSYLPGLEKRLQLISLQAIHDRLQEEGLAGDSLRTAFLREVEAATQDSAIFAHEGRHVIDRNLGLKGSEELEYRAKLSEIAFADRPRLALAGAIIHANIGDDTPHGQANLRVIRGLVEWMAGNQERIDGLDSDRPLLPQLDLLTPEQLRQAARASDPLAHLD